MTFLRSLSLYLVHPLFVSTDSGEGQITPGKTKWDDAGGLFSYLGKEIPIAFPYPKYSLEAYGYLFSTMGQSVDIGIRVYIHDNEIKLLSFGFNNWLKDAIVAKQFSPKAILSTLGVPTQVNIGVILSPYSSDLYPYILDFNYHIDDLWFIANYEGNALLKGNDLLEFCPTDLRQGYQGNRISDNPNFLIQQSDNLYSTNDYVDLGISVTTSSLTLMSASGIDEETFYKKMIGSGGKVCFTTPLATWQKFQH